MFDRAAATAAEVRNGYDTLQNSPATNGNERKEQTLMTNNATVTAAVRLYQASGGDLDDTLACLDFIAGAETANHRPLTEAVARGGFRYALELTKSGLETLQRAERTEPGGTGTKDVVAIQQEIVAWSAERNGNTDPTACRRWLDGNSFHWDDYKQTGRTKPNNSYNSRSGLWNINKTTEEPATRTRTGRR